MLFCGVCVFWRTELTKPLVPFVLEGVFANSNGFQKDALRPIGSLVSPSPNRKDTKMIQKPYELASSVCRITSRGLFQSFVVVAGCPFSL